MNQSNEVTERERALFEVAFADKLDFLRLSPDAEYLYSETGHAWDGWQARASLPQPSAEPVAWVRSHPDGTLTGEYIPDSRIEPVRRNSGAWLPMVLAPSSAPARPAAECESNHALTDGGDHFAQHQRASVTPGTVPAIPRPSADAVMVGGHRLIPDAECVQSKCGCVTTGCWDGCWLRLHPVILAAQLTPAAPRAEAARQIVAGTGISAADQAFFDFWYSHMVNDQMTGAVVDVSHASARYIWDAAQRSNKEKN